MKQKLNICIIFGGKSGEHEVSLQSAKSVFEALDKSKYNVTLIGIDKKGKWLLGDASNYLINADDPKLIKLNHTNAQEITPVSDSTKTNLISVHSGTKMNEVDVFIPLIHGTYGEDGSLQGFFELMDSAYVGAGVLGSAVGMDKDVMKRLLKEAKLPVTPFLTLKKHEITDVQLTLSAKTLGFPLFVKPANLGSSVGVSKVYNQEQLSNAVHEALAYDMKILIEAFVKGREVEVSVLGNENPVASLPGEIIPKHDFYSYEAKYIDENGALLEIPAKLSSQQIKKVQNLAIEAFKVLGVSGMARVDFFFKPNGEFVINEINTIPGFTKISMYPKLWEATGLSYTQLLDKLIKLALDKKKQKDLLKRNYS